MLNSNILFSAARKIVGVAGCPADSSLAQAQPRSLAEIAREGPVAPGEYTPRSNGGGE